MALTFDFLYSEKSQFPNWIIDFGSLCNLIVSSQNEFANKSKRDGHRLGSNGAKFVCCLAKIAPSVGDLVRIVDN